MSDDEVSVKYRTVICRYCGKEFKWPYKPGGYPKYCCDECHDNAKREYFEKYNKKHVNVTANLPDDAIEGEDYVECPICHERHAQITLKHFRRHGYSSMKDVLHDFPDLQITCNRMKRLVQGDNNPMSAKNKTDLERQQSSVYSIQHYLKKYDGDIEKAQSALQEFLNGINRADWKNANNVSYYTDKGYTEQQAHEIIRNKCRSNGPDFYIKKYGEEEGLARYNKRLQQWCDNTFKGHSRSKIADKCINEILDGKTAGMLFGDNEYICNIPGTNTFYKPDLTNLANMKIIEFFGDYWHCNPNKYSGDYIIKRDNTSAAEIWERDHQRIIDLKNAGFDVMVIWETDYRKNHDNVIAEAQKFIFE